MLTETEFTQFSDEIEVCVFLRNGLIRVEIKMMVMIEVMAENFFHNSSCLEERVKRHTRLE